MLIQISMHVINMKYYFTPIYRIQIYSSYKPNTSNHASDKLKNTEK